MKKDYLIDISGNPHPGGVAIIKFPLNSTYDKIHLKLGGGLVAADIEDIKLFANDRPFFFDSGTRINKKQSYKKQAVNAQFITLDFTEPSARGGVVPQMLASIPANLLASLRMEVKISAAANVNSTLECWAEFREPTQNPFILKRHEFNFACPIVGDNDMVLPAGVSGGIIKRIWFYGTDKLTQYELRIDGNTEHRPKKEDWEYQQNQNDLVPQAGLDVIDFGVDGNTMGYLNTGMNKNKKMPTVLLRLKVSAPDNLLVHIDYIDPISRL